MTTDVSEADAPRRTFDEQLGEAIHQELWRRRIKQTDFAENVLGISQAALSNKLRGKRPFYAGELSVIAAALGIPINEIVPTIELDPPPEPPRHDSSGGAGVGAPTRTRTWDLRIIRPDIAGEPADRVA